MGYCKECNREFIKSALHKKYCCTECFNSFRKKSNAGRSDNVERNKAVSLARANKIIICSFCSIEYVKKDGKTKYCSDHCAKKSASVQRNGPRRARKNKAIVSEVVSFIDIYKRDGGMCNHCNIDLDINDRGSRNGSSPVLDHIIPLSRGGDNAKYNIQLLCSKCNGVKGNNIRDCDLEMASALKPESVDDYIKEKRKKSRGATGYIGVVLVGGKYVARIWIEGRYKYIARCDTSLQAATKYNEMALKLKGRNANLNEV